MDKTDKRKKLEELEKNMEKDKSLPLRNRAENLVFGEGDPDADVMFIGEGPGYWEDKKGRPFVGNAGALLNQLLYSIELPREEVFITNVIHYRPPNNRDPKPDELSSFEKYLDKMIKIIDPKIIVTLGRFSMGKFLSGVKISSVHGKVKNIEWEGRKITILPMYHPAAGLRNGEFKRRLKEDFTKIPKALEDVRKEEVKSQGKEDEKSEQMHLV